MTPVATRPLSRPADPPYESALEFRICALDGPVGGKNGLVTLVADAVAAVPPGEVASVLNLGAGRHSWIEDELWARRTSIAVDRVDPADPEVSHPAVRHCWMGRAEQLGRARDASYDVVFANYVLEHVDNVRLALAEVARVLKRDGTFVATVPNPTAPEFRLASVTPLWFHRLFQNNVHATHYSFRSIPELVREGGEVGLRTATIVMSPVVGPYLAGAAPPLTRLGRAWDTMAVRRGRWGLLGACLIRMHRV